MTFYATTNTCFLKLLELIESKKRIPVLEMVIWYDGSRVNGGSTFGECGIDSDEELEIILVRRGC